MKVSAVLLVATVLLAPTSGFGEPTVSDKWSIINYWSITCAPCRIEIPELNELHHELSAVDVNVFGVNYDDDDRKQTLELAKRMGIEFPTLTRAQVEALDLAPPNVLPTTVILSPNGDVAATLVGAQTAESVKQRLRFALGAK